MMTQHCNITEIEMIIQNLYWLSNFYWVMVSTGISPTPTSNSETMNLLKLLNLLKL